MTFGSQATRALAALSIGLVLGCDPDPNPADGGPDDTGMFGDGGLAVPETYAFDSRFSPGTSSVAHSGQTARQVLIESLDTFIGELDGALLDGSVTVEDEGELITLLDYFYGADPSARAIDPLAHFRLDGSSPLQVTYGDISGSAMLANKVAGMDSATDHRDWSAEFVGWSDPAIAARGGTITSPSGLITALFETLEANALAHASPRLSPAGDPLPVHVTESGIDLRELINKMLLMSVNFSQGADDYLDDETEDDSKGLLADNVAAVDGVEPFTACEHAWDEAWGYFGGSESYGVRTAGEIAAGPAFVDRDGDSRIDLFSEIDFAASINAAKRDVGSAASAPTDFAGQAWTAFRTGRAIIARTHDDLDADPSVLAAVQEQRDLAVSAWESAIAATVVHYINAILQVMARYESAFSTADFLELAKAFSEMKGFSLGLQFNRRSPLQAQFAGVQAQLGDRPVLPADGASAVDGYRVDLRSARATLGTVYGFDAASLGDDDGMNGW